MRITEAQVRQIVRSKLNSLNEATLQQIGDAYASSNKGDPIRLHLRMARRILYPEHDPALGGEVYNLNSLNLDTGMDVYLQKLGVFSKTFEAGFIDLYKKGNKSRIAPSVMQAIQTGATPVDQMYNILYTIGYSGATNAIAPTGGSSLQAILTDKGVESVAGITSGPNIRTKRASLTGMSSKQLAGLDITDDIISAMSDYQRTDAAQGASMTAEDFVATMNYFAQVDVDALVKKPDAQKPPVAPPQGGGDDGGGKGPGPTPAPKPKPRGGGKPDPTWQEFADRSSAHDALSRVWVTFVGFLQQVGDDSLLPGGMKVSDLSPSFDTFKKWWGATNRSGGFKSGGNVAETSALMDKIMKDNQGKLVVAAGAASKPGADMAAAVAGLKAPGRLKAPGLSDRGR
jgi:hypothetical protein